MASPFPCCPVNRECHVKGNPDRKKKKCLRTPVVKHHLAAYDFAISKTYNCFGMEELKEMSPIFL